MKRIHDFLGSVKLTYWLLISATALFITGSLYSYRFYKYYEKMDVVPFQKWLSDNISSPSMTWWVIMLYIVLSLLTVNTIVCTINRLKFLIKKRKNFQGTFFKLVIPSAVHLLFIIILTGHFFTFTIAEHKRIPIEKGKIIEIESHLFKVEDIVFEIYPEHSSMKGHVRQCSLQLSEKSNQYKLSYMNPLFVAGRFLHVEIEKRNKTKKENQTTTVCNRSEVKKSNDINPQVFIFETYDPGFFFIIIGLGIVIFLMVLYYIPGKRRS